MRNNNSPIVCEQFFPNDDAKDDSERSDDSADECVVEFEQIRIWTDS